MTRPLRILLVEDNQADIELTVNRLATAKTKNDVQVVKDGEEAMAFLFKQGGFQAAESPDLILLDLNMPKVDGRDVLRALSSDPVLGLIPVLVLSSSAAHEDVTSAYQLRANAYIQKAHNLAEFKDIVAAIDHFWMTRTVLPTAEVAAP